MAITSPYVAERKDVSLFKNNDEYMGYAIELYKEFSCLFASVLKMECVQDGPISHQDIKRCILFGLMRKLEDLNLNILILMCKGSIDSIQILSRTRMEVMVSVLVLLKRYDEEKIFSDYIRYSLCTEKKFYNLLVSDAAKDNNDSLSMMRERMTSSIEASFVDAGIDINKLDIKYEEKNNYWYKSKVYDRFNECGLERFYWQYRLDCHATHGNWQNIYKQFLVYKAGGVSVQSVFEKGVAIPQLVLPIIRLHGQVLSEFVKRFISDPSIKGEIKDCALYCLDEVVKVDESHEVFLVSNGNPTYWSYS